jgi:hypothetical protein
MARGTSVKTIVWFKGMVIACAMPPRKAKTKRGQITPGLDSRTIPKTKLMVKSQPLLA